MSSIPQYFFGGKRNGRKEHINIALWEKLPRSSPLRGGKEEEKKEDVLFPSISFSVKKAKASRQRMGRGVRVAGSLMMLLGKCYKLMLTWNISDKTSKGL